MSHQKGGPSVLSRPRPIAQVQTAAQCPGCAPLCSSVLLCAPLWALWTLWALWALWLFILA